MVYLDYTGSALYPESLVTEHAALLRCRTYGNPHSLNPASIASTRDINAAKQQILRFFDADASEYDVAFTCNASAAIRLVGESFPFHATSTLLLTTDNHNSVNGVREFARRASASVSYIGLDSSMRLHAPAFPRVMRGLFAFPAQSNFSGVRHSLSLVREAQAAGYHVVLDAASYAPTSSLSLRDVPADFVTISFYKMFGYPSGVGALIARRDAVELLQRPWFAGGTVDFVSVRKDRYDLKKNLEAFEDGTVNFLAASGVSLGLAFLDRVGMQSINDHVAALTTSLLARLSEIGGVRIYGPACTRERGGTIAFNVSGRNPDDVVEAAAQHSIALRSGCFCNPGAAEAAGVEGAIRASLGYGSTESDVQTLTEFLKEIS
jgi:selenocysteine lyase/cysteine desulfurase